jgi:2,4-dienoyl-CoA reductase (NADPH2)
VVIIGGGGTGCETALYLAKEATMDAENAIFLKQWGIDENDIHNFMHSGKEITILEMETSVARDVSVVSRSLLRRLLDLNKIEIITKAEVTAVNDKGVEYKKENQKFLKEADTVVAAAGTISENALFTALQGKVAQIHILGDAKSPRKALDAISEAAELAIEI